MIFDNTTQDQGYMVSMNDLNAFLTALGIYFKATGTLEPLAAMQEDNRTANYG